MSLKEIEINIDPDLFLPVYSHLLSSKNSIEFLYGSRDSGKSRNVAQVLVKKCLEDSHFLCPLIRKVFNTIKDSQWQMIKTVVEEWGLDEFFDFTSNPLEIRCINGNKFLSRGLDEPKKIKSLTNPSCAWIEEASDLDENDWILILTSLRSNYNKVQVWVTFNPDMPTDYESSYLYKTFFAHTVELSFQNSLTIKTEDGESTIDYRATHSTYKDNPYCTSERIFFYESLKHTNEYEYKVYALGLWGKRSNKAAFYSAFKRSVHVRQCQLDQSSIFHLSFDQNVVPYNSCLIAQIKNVDNIWELSFIDEIALENPNNKTEDVCGEFVRRYSACKKIFYYGDATSRKRDTRSQYNDYQIIAHKLKKYIDNTSERVPYSNPHVNSRRDFINRILANAYPIRIVVDPRCKLLINDLELVVENIDGSKLKRTIKDKITQQTYQPEGHLSDCFDYMIVAMFKDYFENMKL